MQKEIYDTKESFVKALPVEYVHFISKIDKDNTPNDVHFYNVDEIYERNRDLEVSIYANGYVAIADDGGDEVFLLDTSNIGRIYQVNVGDMKIENAKLVGKTLLDFWNYLLGEQKKLNNEKGEFCSIIWKRNNSVKVKDLLEIKKKLKLPYSANELLAISKELPYEIKRDVRVIVAEREISSLNSLSQMFEIRRN